MARDGITFEQVAAAADALLGNGKTPTIKAVRDSLGTGSPNTIHRHLTALRLARPQAVAGAPELPASLLHEIHRTITRATAEARGAVEELLVNAQAETVELAAAGEGLEVERDQLAGLVAALTTERDRAQATAAERSAELARQAQEIERERQGADTMRVELAKAQLRAEGHSEKLTGQAQEIERLRSALDAEQNARRAADTAAAVTAARLEAAERRANELEARAARGEDQAGARSAELATAHLAIQAAQAQLTSAAREVEEARRLAAEARSAEITAREQAAEARATRGSKTPKTPAKRAPDVQLTETLQDNGRLDGI